MSVIIAPDDDGQRLDRWLKKHYPTLGFGQIQKLVRTGQVRMNGKRVKADTRLEAGAELRLPPMVDAPPAPKHEGLSDKDRAYIQSLVIYDDPQMVVLDKPAGLAVQGGSKITRHVDGMLDGLMADGGVRPRLVHRLDRETSGVLLLARSAETARKLGEDFAGRDVHKTYYAITIPAPKDDKGRIDAALVKGMAGKDIEKMMMDDETGKPSITDYKVLGRAPDNSAALVAFYPLTGRMHQIRVHAALIGCPLLGDKKYGGPGASRLFLHARALELAHPRSGKVLKIEAPLPEAFEKTCQNLGIPAQ